MQVESVLFFETVEEIYSRVLAQTFERRRALPVKVSFRGFANANSFIRMVDGCIEVRISDLLENAPAPIAEALAHILLSKLFRRPVERSFLNRYRRYMNRPEMRRNLHAIRRARGRKLFLAPEGEHYQLEEIFETLNLAHFHGLMARPQLGWSRGRARCSLGHYDPSHNTIVLSRILDGAAVPRIAVEFVLFHEMLHLRYPAEHRGARRCVHTREFKEAEMQFPDWKKAREALRQL